MTVQRLLRHYDDTQGAVLRSPPLDPAARLAVGIPALQIRERVERVPARVPPRRAPLLEVEVAGRRVAGLADYADSVPGVNTVAHLERRSRTEVHVAVV